MCGVRARMGSVAAVDAVPARLVTARAPRTIAVVPAASPSVSPTESLTKTLTTVATINPINDDCLGRGDCEYEQLQQYAFCTSPGYDYIASSEECFDAMTRLEVQFECNKRVYKDNNVIKGCSVLYNEGGTTCYFNTGGLARNTQSGNHGSNCRCAVRVGSFAGIADRVAVAVECTVVVAVGCSVLDAEHTVGGTVERAVSFKTNRRDRRRCRRLRRRRVAVGSNVVAADIVVVGGAIHCAVRDWGYIGIAVDLTDRVIVVSESPVIAAVGYSIRGAVDVEHTVGSTVERAVRA